MTHFLGNKDHDPSHCKLCKSEWLRGIPPETILSVGKTEFQAIQRIYFVYTLIHCKWNRGEAAKLLKIPKRSFYRKLMQYERDSGVKFPHQKRAIRKKCLDCPRLTVYKDYCEICYRRNLRYLKKMSLRTEQKQRGELCLS